jgi:23S rRNA (uracil1939-C5)-methyltransferase
VKLELVIDRIANTGEGIASHNGSSVFVETALPQERVIAHVEGSRGKLLELISRSIHRIEPHCGLAQRCGGCDWLHIERQAQISFKQEILTGTLHHGGSILPGEYELLPALVSNSKNGIRRRATFHILREQLAFFEKRSHQLVPVSTCPALVDSLSGLPEILSQHFSKLLKELESIQVLECEGKICVALLAKKSVKAKVLEAAERLVKECVVNGVILASQDESVRPTFIGETFLEENGVFHRPDGFSQSSSEVNRLMIHEVLERVGHRKQTLLELYSGNGNFTIPLASHAQSIVCVESSPLSIGLAQKGLQALSVKNVQLVQSEAEKAVKGMIAEAKRFECIVLDPPRAGAPHIAQWAERLMAKDVVYVSCDPSTLARDAKTLKAHGFKPLTVRLAEQFCDTHHIECIMSFTRST